MYLTYNWYNNSYTHTYINTYIYVKVTITYNMKTMKIALLYFLCS
jgi:hypothetical protein